MTDPRMDFLRKLETTLSGTFTTAQISIISGSVIKALDDYELTERCTDLAPMDDFNERILKRFIACLRLDGKSERTAYQYRRSCQRLSDLTGKRFDEIGPYDIRMMLAQDMERGLKASSIENQRANLSAFFQWLHNEEIIDRNPVARIAPIKYTKEVRKAFSEVEIDALRSGCHSLKDRALIEFLLATGARVSELASMSVSDISTETMTVHIRHGKGSKERITYISDVALKHLLSYLHSRKETGSALFYNKNHEALTADGVRFILNEIAKRAGVENVHPHRFRRTFATGLAKRGMPVQEIQILMGHVNINTTMVYIAMDDTQLQASYKRHTA